MDLRNEPSQETNPNVDQSTKAWFESIDSPNPLPSSVGPEPSGKKWKFTAIILVCVLVIGGVFALLATYAPKPASTGKCLDSSQYEDFLGRKHEDTLRSQDNFYTQPVRFEAGTASYLAKDKSATDTFLKNIGALYQNNHGESSIVVSITSDYLSGGSEQIAKDRLTKLKQALVEYGVAESAIKTNEPQAITTEDEAATDVSAIISISSHSKCQST